MVYFSTQQQGTSLRYTEGVVHSWDPQETWVSRSPFFALSTDPLLVLHNSRDTALLLPVFLTEPAGFTNCLSTRTDSKADNEIILWTMPLVFDSLVLTLTIARYFRMRSRTGGMEIPILRKIVNKHISYFAMITTLNVINVAFFSRTSHPLAR